MLRKYILTFLISIVPVIELRGSILFGFAQSLPWQKVIPLSIIGNMLPVPFILLFIRKILDYMKKTKRLRKLAEWVEAKAAKNTEKVMKYAFFGLVLFVGIPLPGTGAWTGALVAALMDMRMKYALPAIFLGLIMASVIMWFASYGAVGFLSFLTN